MNTSIQKTLRLVAFGVLVLLGGQARAHAEEMNRLPIESLMRELQARYHYFSTGYLAWPDCECESPDPKEAPHFPPNGFYDECIEDEDDIRAMLQEIYAISSGQMWQVYIIAAWLNPTWSPEGQPWESSYEHDMHFVNYPIIDFESSISTAEIFEIMQDFVESLVTIELYFPSVVQRAYFGDGRDPDSNFDPCPYYSTGPTCADRKETAYDRLESDLQHGSEEEKDFYSIYNIIYSRQTFYQQSIYAQIFEDPCAVNTCGNLDCLWCLAHGYNYVGWLVSAGYTLTNSKLKAELDSSNSRKGTGRVYLLGSIGAGPVKTPPEPPVALDSLYHLSDLVPDFTASTIWTSNWIISEDGFYEFSCVDNGDNDCDDPALASLESLWTIDDALCLFSPSFEMEPDDEACGDDVLLPGDPKDNDKPDEGDGQGGEGGGGNGSEKVNGEDPCDSKDGKGGKPTPTTSDPVIVHKGYKYQHETDLTVHAPGMTFSLDREYTSNGLSTSTSDFGLVGTGWTMSAFSFLKEEDVSGHTELIWSGSAKQRVRFIPQGSGPVKWQASGPVTGWIEESTLDVDGVTYPTWKMIEPGVSETHYYRTGTGVSTAKAGLLLQWKDVRGNNRTYSYTEFGTTTKTARLRQIDLNRRDAVSGVQPNPPQDVTIAFSWNIRDDADVSAAQGRLARVDVLRYFENGVPRLVKSVGYTYFDEDFEFESEDPIHADVGTDGDLIQVTYRELVDRAAGDAEPMYHTRVKQYRYHSGTGTSSSVTTRSAADGQAHQLKCVIEPEQMEYFAQKRHAGDMTVDDDAVQESATFLLTQADDDTWSDGVDTREVFDLASKVVSYYNTANGSGVSTQFLQSSCGCGGGSPQGVRHDFSYVTYTSGGDEWRSTIIEEHKLVGGSYDTNVYRRRYYDAKKMGPSDTFYLIHKVLEDPSGSVKRWVTTWDYDGSNNVERVSTPAAVSSATDYTPITTSSAPSVTLNSTGLCYGYVYNADNRLIETRVGNAGLSIANYTLLSKTYYPESPTASDERTFLPERVDRFVAEVTSAGSASADEVLTTWYRYGFRGSSDDIGWMRTSVEAETSGENGPADTGSDDPEGGTVNVYDTWTFYDTFGRSVWSFAPDKAATYHEYEPVTGYMTAIVTNADPAGSAASGNPEFDTGDYPALPVSTSGWGRYAEGGSLKTTYAHDYVGRVVERTSPGGVKSSSRREMRECEDRPGIKYLASIGLPHKLDSDEFNGPMSITWMNAGGKAIQSSEYALDGTEDYDPLDGEYTVLTTAGTSGELSRSTTQHTVSGLVSSTKRYADLGGGYPTTGGEVVYTTSYDYDALGRVWKITDAGGTVTENAAYDVLDRVLEVKVGTTSTTAETVAKYFYDSATMAQGVGNGNLTFTRLYTGENGGFVTTYRDTQHVYDGRDRLRKTIPPLNAGVQQAPYVVLAYDNLDRVIQRGLFTGSPTATGNDYGIGDTSKRAFYVEMHYGQRGMLARKRVATDPAQSSPNWLATDTWYDSVGRAVSQSFPSSPRIKRVFDAHGRSIEEYLTDARNDVAPGASGSYEDAVDIDNDVVLEQTVREYNDEGLLISEHMYSLVHDEQGETTFGSLADAASSKCIVTTTGYVYDDADRVAATIDYGTNDADDKFISGTALPTVPTTVAGLSSLPSWAIVNQVEYDPDRGVVKSTIDPLGRMTTTLYDDLYRPIATIENYDDTNPVTLAWDGTHGRWSVTAGLNTSEPDVNRVTSFVYDGLDHVTRRVAHMPGTSGEKVQVTAYEYGVVSNSPNYAHNSLVNSNNLLHVIRYPDDTTGEVSTTSDHLVWFAYDRLGEMRFAADQNGGGHAYHRDTAGRVTRDWAITVSPLTGVMAIDSTVSSIYTSYDKMGRMTSVKSRDASGGIVNSVRFEYTPLWQIDKVYQDADGTTADSGGPLPEVVVDYDYETLTGGGAYGNTSRLTQMTYPSGSELEYLYDDNVSDRISRVTNLELDGTGIVGYSYLGAATPVVTDYMSADVQLDYTLDADGKRRATGYTETAQGFYPGLDRFGRVKRHTWADGDLHYDGTSGPTMPPHISRVYAYDNNSNVTLDYDGGTGGNSAVRPDVDFVYQYDELDRLIEARRGAWNGSALVESSASGDKRSEKWRLDMLGNWLEYQRNLDGSVDGGGLPTYTDGSSSSSPDTQTRGFNAFNEITTVDPDDAGGGTSTAAFTYDHNGTLRELPAISGGPTQTEGGPAKRFYYDCWNRLVRVDEDVNSTGTFSTIAEYEYNGLNWRTKKTCRTDQSSTTMTQTRVMYYDASWRLIEEHITNPPPATIGCEDPEQRVAQQVWGVRGLDDAILRRIEKAQCVDIDPDPEDVVHDWQYTFNIPSTYAGWDAVYYYLTDATFSPRGLTLGDGTLFSRIDYDAYGRGRRWNENVNAADFNGVNGVTVQDIFDFLTAWLAGDPSADINGVNGVTVQDIFDFLSLWLAGGGPEIIDGLISASADLNDGFGNYIPAPDSPIGYRGYVFNPEVSGGGLYTVRFRNYLPLLGRWLERDPAGFVDGSNLYEYVASRAIIATDPFGLRLVIKGNAEFRKLVEQALQQLCPGIKVNNHGAVEFPDEYDYFRDQDKDCEDQCKHPPGCDLIYKLVRSFTDFTIDQGKLPNTEYVWKKNDKRKRIWVEITYKPGYSEPIDHRNSDKRTSGREANDWETLWHEIIHATRLEDGNHPGGYGVDKKDISKRRQAIEEIETIDHMNKLRAWYRKCSTNDNRETITPRDPFGHPKVDPVWPEIQKDYPNIERPAVDSPSPDSPSDSNKGTE